MVRLILLTLAAAWWGMLGSALAADEPSAAENERSADVDELVRQLSSSSFIQRDWASRRLIGRGPGVVPELVAAVKNSEDEPVSSAVVRQLARMSVSRDLSIAAAAMRGLSSLHQGPEDLSPAVRENVGHAYQEAARHNLAQLAALGAQIEWDDAGKIDEIAIRSEQFDDRFMPLACALTAITRLDLRNSSITGDGLPHLASLVNLEHLNLTDTQLTGEDLRQLPALPRLRQLTLYRIPLSAEDRRWLEQHLPQCHVNP